MVVLKTLLIEQHGLFNENLKQALKTIDSFQIIAEIDLDIVKMRDNHSLEPDLIFLDLEGIKAKKIIIIKDIKKNFPNSNLVVINDYKDACHLSLIDYVNCGVQGLLSKDMTKEEFTIEIKTLLEGEIALPQAMGKQLYEELLELQTMKFNDRAQKITERECEIIRLVANGVTNKEIAKLLFISENTVKNHLCNIMEKLNVDNRVKIASFAWNMGLVNLLV